MKPEGPHTPDGPYLRQNMKTNPIKQALIAIGIISLGPILTILSILPSVNWDHVRGFW